MRVKFKISLQILFILFSFQESAFSKTGQFKPGGKTPTLESSELFDKSRPTGAVKLEVADKISKSSDLFYGHSLEMERHDAVRRHKVYLKIKVTNVLSKNTSPLTIRYEIFGGERKMEVLRAIQVGKTSIAGSGEFSLTESLKFGESRVFRTDPYYFEMQILTTSFIVVNKGAMTARTMSGMKYIGYHVSVYDDKNILLAEANG